MTSPVPTTPARFFRVDCHHPTLFRESYIRCYQNHGFKVIRCFPHCCPHTKQRGCGASLSVALSIDSSIPRTRVFAFGRFEVVGDESIVPGETVPWQTFACDVRSAGKALATWIRGRADETTRPGGEIVFHFNENCVRGWHYGWQSSASAKKRRALHRFHVYSVHQTSELECVVVDAAASPPFSMSSYRRTRDAATNDHARSSSSERTTQELRPTSTMSQTQAQAHQLWLVVQMCSNIQLHNVAPQWASIEQQVLARCYARVGCDPGVQPLQHILPPAWTQAQAQHCATHGLTNIALAILLQWFDSAVVDSLHQFTRNHDQTIEHVATLHEAYNQAIELLHRWLTQMLPFEMTLNAFTESVEMPLREVTPHEAIGFDAFVQVLEHSFDGNLSGAEPPDTENTTNGLWIMDSICVQTLDRRWSVCSIIKYFTMGFALHLRLDEPNGKLYAKSKMTLFPATWTVFELNGQPNQLQVFPNGQSCRWGTSGVDYIGWRDPNHSFSILIYVWPELEAERAHHLRLRLTPDIQNISKMHLSLISERANLNVELDTLDVGERIHHWNEVPHELGAQMDATYICKGRPSCYII
ncbi:Aste57867_2085 [Aphanomyces stellatus]|uniref:Aste57867_2085 protein n=1 Tax=Aphanomyces stellatus TaxID=120398 RepID=A0A485K7T2_9STRA|nr:hypothetical protein As57867_002080 [Aphanomyces stellatus]VFT79288.1 Aste57867_2085 [Aphanomyces stellatus]